MQTPAPVQTTYAQYMPVGQAGMPATASGWDVDSCICQDDTSPPVGVGFGLAVSRGTDSDRAAVLGAPSGHAFRGITRADPTLPNLNSNFTDKYQDGDNMNVFVRGDIWVVAEGHVGAGETVYFDASTGALGHSGGTAINDAVWMTSALAGGLAVVRLGVATGNAGPE